MGLGMTEIRTERLVLRSLQDSDAEALANAANNYEIVRWLAVLPYPYTLNDARNYIEKAKKKPVTAFGVFHNDRFVGAIGTEGHTGLGYWLAQDVWGKGFATEVVKAILDWYFDETQADKIRSGYIVGNHGSARIQEKLGFEIVSEGLVDTLLLEGVNHVNTMLTRDRWLSL